MVAMEVEGDVDTITNEMTNTKCSLATDDAQRQVFKDIQDEMELHVQTAQTYLGGDVPHRKRHPGIVQVPEKRDAFSNTAVDNIYHHGLFCAVFISCQQYLEAPRAAGYFPPFYRNQPIGAVVRDNQRHYLGRRNLGYCPV